MKVPVVTVNGVDINYVDEGAGETLLLIHNVVANVDAFADNIPFLARHFRVIACDIRGHGRSSKIEDEARAAEFYNFERIAEDISLLLEHLGVETYYVLGQAFWGGSAAGHLLDLDFPRVKGIIFSSSSLLSMDDGVPPYKMLGPQGVARFERMIALARSEGMMGVYEERIRSKQFWSERVLNSPEILARFADMHRATSPTAFANFPHFSHAKKKSIVAKIRQEQVPVMVMLGSDDSDTEKLVRGAREDYDQTHVITLPDCGHYLAIENPLDFNLAVSNFVGGCILRSSNGANGAQAN
jgi:pimeloyl-ACP methyl ester carboxylesterase